MRRVTTTLALALCLLGCSLAPGPVELLTGVDACWAGGEQPGPVDRLLADPTYGTRIYGKPVMWPVGYTGMRLFGGEVAVLNGQGKVVATTGREYRLSAAMGVAEEKRALMESIDVFPAVGDFCGYGWDLIDCSPPAPGSPQSEIAGSYCPLSP